MQEHHLQKDILYRLVLSDSARFADLRPRHVDSNVFTYHLKQLIKEKLVIKTDDGLYSLTPLGRVAGINVTLSKKELLEQAHSVMLLCLRTEEDGWLLRKRLAQPMFEKIGFTHAEPKGNEKITVTAKQTFMDRTGLSCNFQIKGTGYVKLFRGNDQESFVHFTLLFADSYSGKLVHVARNGENIWLKEPDFKDSSMIPSMHDLVQSIDATDGIFYADLSYQI